MIRVSLSFLALLASVAVEATPAPGAPTLGDCFDPLTEAVPTGDAFRRSRDFGERVRSFARALEHARLHSEDLTPLKTAVGGLLEVREALRDDLERGVARAADEAEQHRRRLVENAPDSVKIHSDRWEAMSQNLSSDVARAREAARLPLRSFDELGAVLGEMRRALASATRLPRAYRRVFEIAPAPGRVRSRLSDEALARQWSEARDPLDTPEIGRSRHFLLGLTRDPHMNLFRLTVQALAIANGVRVDVTGPVDLEAEPERIAEKTLHSISYVGPHRRVTFRNAGFVLDVPQENILTTHFEDAGSLVFARLADPARRLRERQILGPDELNQFSYVYNEINVVGTHPRTGRKIRVIGVYLRVDRAHRPLVDASEVAAWTAYARAHGFPPPVLVADESHAEWTAQGERSLWLAAGELARVAPEFDSPDWTNWSAAVSSVLFEIGNTSLEARAAMRRLVRVEEIAAGRFGLCLVAEPPSSLRWPFDESITYRDVVRSRATGDPGA